MSSISMWIIWLIIAVLALIVEAFTMGLTSVWFAVGCFVAMIMDLAGCNTLSQIIVMAIVTLVTFVVCMIWIKPQFDKKKGEIQHTNSDRCIGCEGLVIKDINPIEGKGQVKVNGEIWSAKAQKSISEGTKIKVLAIEGVKLVVEQL